VRTPDPGAISIHRSESRRDPAAQRLSSAQRLGLRFHAGRKIPMRRVKHVGRLSSAGSSAPGVAIGRFKLLHVLLAQTSGQERSEDAERDTSRIGHRRSTRHRLGIALKLARPASRSRSAGRRTLKKVQSALDQLVSSVSSASIYVQADVASGADSRASYCWRLKSNFGRLDVLVNNAGIAPRVRADILEAREETLR
jgi:hypothetical protein